MKMVLDFDRPNLNIQVASELPSNVRLRILENKEIPQKSKRWGEV